MMMMILMLSRGAEALVWGEGPGGKLRGEPIMMMLMMMNIILMINDDDNKDEDYEDDFDNDGKCAACWGRQGLVRHGHHLCWVNVIITLI